MFTDSGRVCDNLVKNFKICHAAFLESNYDEEMLELGNYPLSLKNRIRGGVGHISNKEALQLFLAHRPSFMTHLFLAHLSKNNNTPEIAEALFKSVAGETRIIVASRSGETEVFEIDGVPVANTVSNYAHKNKSINQLTLFS